jgi:hypothetical protein
VLVKEQPRTVTSHIFLSLDATGADLVNERGTESSKGGCGIARVPGVPMGSGSALVALVAAATTIARRRSRPPRR